MFADFGKLLIGLGIALLVLGALLLLAGRFPGLGRLPGDLVIERENLRVFIPIGTMILLSLILTVVLNVIARIGR
jgi:hypothetical protein